MSNSSIKPKIGDCKKSGCRYNGPLIGGMCSTHYWEIRQKISKAKPKNKAEDVVKGVMGVFFANQVLKMPRCCEESGQPLPMYPAWLKLSCCAHILKKRKDYGFPSVALHPMNMIYLHPDIHTNMDNLGEQYILKMKSLPLMKERVKILLPLLTQKELNKVPYYLL